MRSPSLIACVALARRCVRLRRRACDRRCRRRRSPTTPADDLAEREAPRRSRAQRCRDRRRAKDPRVVDLDIIRITATQHGVGGEPELTSVATADLFRQANDAAQGRPHQDAIALYRQLVTEFPDSQFAPVALFNIAAIYDGQGDLAADDRRRSASWSTTLPERARVDRGPPLHRRAPGRPGAVRRGDRDARRGPRAHEPDLADRVEAFARKGYVRSSSSSYDDADRPRSTARSPSGARRPRIDDPYYIAMAHYYRGEVAHQPVRSTRRSAPATTRWSRTSRPSACSRSQAYDRWKESLGFKHAYWATAAGYQMSQIFVELWQAHVDGAVPAAARSPTRAPSYVAEVHGRVREHLEKALEGHRMNVELAKAYGVEHRVEPGQSSGTARPRSWSSWPRTPPASYVVEPGTLSRDIPMRPDRDGYLTSLEGSSMTCMASDRPCRAISCWRSSMVEQLICNQQVAGSSPIASSD